MHINILLKQIVSSLEDLKAHITKFEKHQSPSTQYAQQLHTSIQQTNKLLSAYVVLKEQNDISPDLDIHLKLMSAPTITEILIVKEELEKQVTNKEVECVQQAPIKPIESVNDIIQPREPITLSKLVNTSTTSLTQNDPIVIEEKSKSLTAPLVININDKFRIINELFLGNATEYAVAIEQLNALDTLESSLVFMKEISAIYNWNTESEMFKKINILVSKRFTSV